MFKDTIIIGCGPAGLQAGYFLKLINHDYIILESSNTSASFFSKYPHSKELISINKVYNDTKDKDFNLRHDWNSLLNNHKLEMKKYTKSYYPSNDNLFKYLNDFSKLYKLKIQYNTRVYHITKIQENNINFKITCTHDDKEEVWTCNKLIIATGLSIKNTPNINNINLYAKHYSDFPKGFFLDKKNLEKYNNKKVLIIGQGNSSFELAQILTPHCSNIVILGRNSTPKPSICTHYVGDVRSKYFGFYDTFILKSLNAFNHLTEHELYDSTIVKTNDNKFFIKTCKESCECQYINYDEIINCTGWSFDSSIFDESINLTMNFNNKYPVINGLYESISTQNLFFIGALMHSFDYKQSSGGFIHGFRYLIDNFVKINYTKFTPKLFNLDTISKQFSNRINQSSALYQMHGQLCDIFYKIDDNYIYYEEVPLSYICTNKNTKIYIPHGYIFILTLEYGTKIESDLKRLGTRTTNIGTESSSLLLHPVLRIYKHENDSFSNTDVFYPNYTNLLNMSFLQDIIHFDEDLLTDFTSDIKYNDKFYRIMKSYS
jgi:thioredoxin reductase